MDIMSYLEKLQLSFDMKFHFWPSSDKKLPIKDKKIEVHDF